MPVIIYEKLETSLILYDVCTVRTPREIATIFLLSIFHCPVTIEIIQNPIIHNSFIIIMNVGKKDTEK